MPAVSVSPSRKISYEVLKELLDKKLTVGAAEKKYPDFEEGSKEWRFYRQLVMGSLRILPRLDAILEQFVSKKPAPALWVLLRLSAYELLYMNTPERAVLSQWVEFSKQKSFGKNSSGFINGVLRSISRSKGELLSKSWDPYNEDQLEAALCLPKWLIELASREWGLPAVIQMGRLHQQKKSWDIWSPKGKVWLMEFLNSHEIPFSENPIGKNCLRVSNLDEALLPAMSENSLRVQAIESQLVSELTIDGLKEGKVWDVCAGVGRKTEYMKHAAHRFGERGEDCPSAIDFWLTDASESKVMDAKKRFSGSPVKSILKLDSSSDFPRENAGRILFDRILVDAPCSSLGVLRDHPEAVWIRDAQSIEQFPKLQGEILANASKSLKSGGKIIYSVCTFTESEGPYVVRRFLESSEGKDFKRVDLRKSRGAIPGELFTESGEFRSFPGLAGESGFFIAALIRG